MSRREGWAWVIGLAVTAAIGGGWVAALAVLVAAFMIATSERIP